MSKVSDLEDTQGKTFGSGFFDTFRTLPFPPLYGSMKTPVTADVLEAGLLFAIAILAFSFFLILPGVIFRKRLVFFLKVFIGLFILISIFLCNFGQEWEVAEIHNTATQYKAGVRQEIHADIGVKIGLRSVNITLKAHDDGTNTVSFGPLANETINYNERFSWDNLGWVQGRAGFGPNAGRINQEFRAAQFKGLPYPILWIAEYFVPDGEGIRWGRYYRQAGYYTHIFMWLAFPLYILSVVLIMMVRSYGALFFLFTGMSMIGGNFCYGFIRNPTQLKIPFDTTNHKVLEFHWGWCFWLCLFTGLLNILLGIAAFVLDFVCPDWLCDFLNIDTTKDYEEFYLSREELENLGIVVPKNSQPGGGGAGGNNYRQGLNGAANSGGGGGAENYHGFRKRPTRIGTMHLGKSTYRIMQQRDLEEMNNGRAPPTRPPIPSMEPSDGHYRAPVVPEDAGYQNRSVGYNNPAMDYDDVIADGGDDTPAHLQHETAMKQMDQYDNNQANMKQQGVSHFSYSRENSEDEVVSLEPQPREPLHPRRPSDDPIYDNTTVPESPRQPLTSMSEKDEGEDQEDQIDSGEKTENNNVNPLPLPPRGRNVTFDISNHKDEDKGDKGDYLVLENRDDYLNPEQMDDGVMEDNTAKSADAEQIAIRLTEANQEYENSTTL